MNPATQSNFVDPGETKGDFESGANLSTTSWESKVYGDVGDSELGTCSENQMTNKEEPANSRLIYDLINRLDKALLDGIPPKYQKYYDSLKFIVKVGSFDQYKLVLGQTNPIVANFSRESLKLTLFRQLMPHYKELSGDKTVRTLRNLWLEQRHGDKFDAQLKNVLQLQLNYGQIDLNKTFFSGGRVGLGGYITAAGGAFKYLASSAHRPEFKVLDATLNTELNLMYGYGAPVLALLDTSLGLVELALPDEYVKYSRTIRPSSYLSAATSSIASISEYFVLGDIKPIESLNAKLSKGDHGMILQGWNLFGENFVWPALDWAVSAFW